MCNITKENGAVGASLVWLRLRILICTSEMRNMYARILALMINQTTLSVFVSEFKIQVF
jgi:hypothetical protein